MLNEENASHLGPTMAARNNDDLLGLVYSKQNQLRRFLRSKMPSLRHDEADDIVQDTYTSALRHAGTLRGRSESGVLTWLCTVAKRKVIDRVRANKAQKRGGNTLKFDIESAALPSKVRTPSSFAACDEGKKILEAAMKTLTPRYRTAIESRYFERLPHAETARKLNISEKAAQMLTQRALTKLRSIIGNESRVL